jgi:DNA-binding transcriptional ArsR family regulator
MTDTVIEKILKLLSEGHFSTREISEKLGIPLSSVRATISQLRHMDLVEDVPREGSPPVLKRGKTFTLTQEGRDYVRKKMETTKQ